MITAYFDTNVYNNWVLRDGLNRVGSIARELAEAGFRVQLSPVNVLEILQTPDPAKREDLVMACQMLCDAELLVEPEALVIDQVLSQVPDSRGKHLALRTATDGSVMAAVWADVRADLRKTFVVDRRDLTALDVSRSVFAYFHSHFSRGGTIEDADFWSGMGSSVTDILHSIRMARNLTLLRQPVPDRSPQVGAHLFMLSLAVLCVGWTPFPARVDAYWSALGLTATAERIDYVGTALWPALHLTALHGMAAIMAWQCTKPYNRGNFFDCYHVAYLPHVDMFVTDDAQLREVRRWWPASTLLAKIVDVDALQRRLAG